MKYLFFVFSVMFLMSPQANAAFSDSFVVAAISPQQPKPTAEEKEKPKPPAEPLPADSDTQICWFDFFLGGG